MAPLPGEKLKTILLVVLVLTSLVMTYLVWYGMPPYEETEVVFQESFFFEEPKEKVETIKPEQILIPVEEEQKVILNQQQEKYEQIWTEIKPLLEENLSEEEQVGSDQLPEDDACLMVEFDPPFPIEIEHIPYLAGLNQLMRLEFYFASETFIRLEGEEEFQYELPEDDFVELQEMVADFEDSDLPRYELLELEADNDENEDIEDLDLDLDIEDPEEIELEIIQDIYLPVEEVEMYNYIDLMREDLALEELLQAVFVNHKLARQIEEPDGTLIFTDGEKGLRVSKYLEYTAPKLEGSAATHSYDGAIQEANEFLCYYGGWPDGLYLDAISRTDETGIPGGEGYFNARWRYYHQGYPVVGNLGETEVKFNDRGLYFYQRTLFAPGDSTGEKKNISWNKKVLSRALEFYVEQNIEEYINEDNESAESFHLEDIYLAYHLEDFIENNLARAYPVWVVEIEGEVIYLDVSELNPFWRGEEDEYIES